MLQYDFSTTATAMLPMPSGTGVVSWNHYSFVWNELRGAFLLFGGEGTPSAGSYFYEFKPSSSTPWTLLQSSGSVPPHTSDSCMVSAFKGTKVLLFGGHVAGQPLYQMTDARLYILDVATMTWSQGPSSQSRNGMACAVSGNYMVVWVGKYEYPSLAPLVYNINSGLWTAQYGYNNLPEEPPASEGSKAIEAAFIGGAVAVAVAVAVILAVTLSMLSKRHRRRQQNRMERDIPKILQVTDQKVEVEAMGDVYSKNRESIRMTGIDPESQKRISALPHPAPQCLPPSPRSPCSISEVVSAISAEDQIHQLPE
ncbi:MAG: hypothetical protein J3R72DRAFT_503801 [Linnemannia gamsii]|nr:MAG: hypothetical protein J3R72DRAFT_503801 [Linnemannia gamsii]